MDVTVCVITMQRILHIVGMSSFLLKGLVYQSTGMAGRAEKEIYLTATTVSSPSITPLSLHPSSSFFFLFDFLLSLLGNKSRRGIWRKRKRWNGEETELPLLPNSAALYCDRLLYLLNTERFLSLTELWNKKTARPRRSWQDLLRLRLTKMQLFCTRAETNGEEVIGVQSFSPFRHLIVTSMKDVGFLPSAQWEWTAFCLIALRLCTDMK